MATYGDQEYLDSPSSDSSSAPAPSPAPSVSNPTPYRPPSVNPTYGDLNAYGGGGGSPGNTYAAIMPTNFGSTPSYDPGYNQNVRATFEGYYGDPVTAYHQWLSQSAANNGSKGWDNPATQAIFTNTYGPGGSQYNPNLTPQQVWQQQNAQGGQGGGANNGGLGVLPMNDSRRQALQQAGSPRWNDPSLTAADYQSISSNAQMQGQEAAYGRQQQAVTQATLADAQSRLATSLLSQLNGQMGPGLVPAINSALAALGMPAISNGQTLGAEGLMPNAISPAMWDAMPDAAKQMILLGYQARGGDPKDFVAGIDAQRPKGAGAGANVHYAPLARAA